MLVIAIPFYKITQVILAFWLVLAYDLLEVGCTIDVIITKFFFCILKWRKVLRIKIIFYTIGKKIRTKKGLSRHWTGTRGIVYRKKNDKAVFFLRKWHRKNSPAVRRRARLNQTQNWLVSRELLLNKPNKQNVDEIDSFNKFNLSQWQEIHDTLIDVRNEKHQNTTS